jgi:FkbM family methyltransferase
MKEFLKSIRTKMLNPVLIRLDNMENLINNGVNSLNDITEYIKSRDSLEDPQNLCDEETNERIMEDSVSEQPSNNLVLRTLTGPKYSISLIDYSGENFFWVTQTEAKDPISDGARAGIVFAPSELFTLFPQKGVFLDIGANIGAVSLPLSTIGWKGFAIEASSENCDVLQCSIDLNQFDITLCQYAVWEKTETLHFCQNGPWGCVQTDNINFESVEGICLNDFESTPLKNLERLDLIKIDIEGSEVAALIGMDKFLERFDFPPIFIEINSLALFCTRGDTQWSLLSQSEKMGYLPFIIKDGFLHQYSKDFFINEIWGDYLLIHISKVNLFKDIISSNHEGMTNQEAKSFVLKHLNDYLYNKEEKFGFEWAVSICSALKHFPIIAEDPDVVGIMRRIKKMSDNNPIVANALSWFTC